jgi:hypothetical protein
MDAGAMGRGGWVVSEWTRLERATVAAWTPVVPEAV